MNFSGNAARGYCNVAAAVCAGWVGRTSRNCGGEDGGAIIHSGVMRTVFEWYSKEAESAPRERCFLFCFLMRSVKVQSSEKKPQLLAELGLVGHRLGTGATVVPNRGLLVYYHPWAKSNYKFVMP